MGPSKQRPNRVFGQNQAKQNAMVYRAKRTIVPRLLHSENKRNTIKNLGGGGESFMQETFPKH